MNRLGTALIVLAAAALCSCGGQDIPRTEINVTTAAEVTAVQTASVQQTETETAADTAGKTEVTDMSETEKSTAAVKEVPAETVSRAEQLLSELTLREKVGQLFMARFDSIIYDDNGDHYVQAMDDALRDSIGQYPVGGFIAMGANISGEEQITRLNADVSALYDKVKPFICTDEEGGFVARIANSGCIDVPSFPSMSIIAAEGDVGKASEVGRTIGGYLKRLGFNLDLAPVADVNTNPLNIVIGARAFGSDPERAAEFVSAVVDGLHESGIMSCLKHFPGHGDTAEDTHFMTAAVNKTWEEMKECELIPFIGSLDKTDMIMAAHIIAPKVTGDDTPASLSRTLLTEKLRNELGYDGVIITDGLSMEAINKYYTSEECCIRAIQAGAGILLKPTKDHEAFEAVQKAVEDGVITQERLDESVLRILRLKEKYGLLG